VREGRDNKQRKSPLPFMGEGLGEGKLLAKRTITEI